MTATLHKLQKLSEPELYRIVEHLLKTLGYGPVRLMHGTLEAGKDIVFAERDKIGREVWRAIQVKAFQLTGSLTSPKGFRSALLQCEAALDTPYSDSNGRAVRIAEVWLITPFPATESAKFSGSGRLNQMERVHVIDGPDLANLIDKNMPEFLDSGGSPLDKYFSDLISACDSPEEYLSERLRVRYSFQQVYIPSEALISVPAESAIKKMPRLQELVTKGIREFDDFGRAGVLSGSDFRSVMVHLSRLRRAAETARVIPAMMECATGLLDQFPVLISALGLPVDLFGLQSHRMQVMALDLAKNVNENLLSTLSFSEAELSTIPKYLDNYFNLRGKLREEPIPALARAYSNAGEVGPLDALIAFIAPRIYSRFTRTLPVYSLRLRQELYSFSEAIEVFDQTLRASVLEGLKQAEPYIRGTVLGVDIPTEPLMKLCACALSLDLLVFMGIDIEEVKLRCDALTMGERVARVLFIGPLGIGKTTLLKQLCSRAVRSYGVSERHRIPILCTLGSARDQQGAELKDIALAAAKVSVPGVANYQSCDIEWILDGLDEIESATLKERLLAWAGLGSFAGGHWILGSRPAALDAPVPGFVRLWIDGFSRAQIEDFIERFPWADKERGRRLSLVLSKNPELAALAETPLVLTLITLLCQHHEPDRLPSRRDELYERIARLLMGDWDVAKGFQRPRSLADIQQRTALVERAAFSLYDQRRSSFTRNDFAQTCLRGAPAGSFEPGDIEKLTDELITDCLLTPVSISEYKFFHFSVHEYFAAKELSRDISTDRLQGILIEYFRSNGSWWEEVLVFYAGIKRDVTALVANILGGSLAGETEKTNPLLMRLLKRMLAAADLTSLAGVKIRGSSVQKALDEMRVPWGRYAT